jgi:hypothetical protein
MRLIRCYIIKVGWIRTNILRGHLIIDCMNTGVLVQLKLFIRIAGISLRVLTLVFELCVIFIQAFVFSLLSCIYLAEAYVWLTAVFPIFRTYMNSMVSIPTWYWAWYCSDIWSSMVMEAIVISSIVFSLPMESGRLVFRINGTYSMLDYNLTCTGLVGIKEVWNLVGNKCSISI